MRNQCYTLLWRFSCALFVLFLFAPPADAQTVVSISGAQTTTWTAPPVDGPYFVRITARGGDGGLGTGSFSAAIPGGGGAILSGVFQVEAGETLRAISGARGGDRFVSDGSGGGGAGAGVVNVSTNTFLLIAGGGGGGGNSVGASVVPGNGNGGIPSSSYSYGDGGGGGGVNGPGQSAAGDEGGKGGGQVSANGLSAGGAGVDGGYYTSGRGGSGMGGGGGGGYGRGGGGGGQTGGTGFSVSRSLPGGACQQNTGGSSTFSPQNGFVTIELLVSTTLYYRDADGDGFGDANSYILGPQGCTPLGYASNNQDCDDTKVLYQDSDGDGFGSTTKVACDGVATNTDCNDGDNTIYPGAPEVCDGKDNNCNGQVDESGTNTYYEDSDGDGFGNEAVMQQSCTQPAGYVTNNTDCNDKDNTIFPGAPEVCDGKDNNCNGSVDEGFTNTDGDSQADCVDPDDDNDGVADAQDNCLLVANASQADLDGDGQGDVCDTDDDGDGVADAQDCAPLDATKYRSATLYFDADGDGYHNGSQTVCYGATVPTGYVATTKGQDNCPSVANPTQTDTDRDGQGDACDGDDDGDGVLDTRDNCPLVSNASQADLDRDGKGDACDDDMDGDGIIDAYDCEPRNGKVAKYLVCHEGQTLCVDKRGMQDHVKHGDKLGRCGTRTSVAMRSETLYELSEQAPGTSSVYPNPSRGVFSLQLNSAAAGRVQVLVLDAKGSVLEHRTVQVAIGRQTLSFNLQGKAAGLYMLKVIGTAGDQLFKVYVQH